MLLSIMQNENVPVTAVIAEGMALLVYFYLSIRLFLKYRGTKKDATLNLFFSFAFYFVAILFLFSTKTYDYLNQTDSVYTLGINIGYSFSAIGNLFLFYFTEDIFFDKPKKYLREVITLANGATLGFLMIFIFQLQEFPFLELPGEYISTHLLIWHVLVSSTGFFILVYKSYKARAKTTVPLHRGGFLAIGLSGLLEIFVFIFFFIDILFGGGFTIWYMLAWGTASLAGFSSMSGFLMPNWFKNRFKE